MEPMDLKFDFRDIFKSPRLALSGKKIWVFIIANFISYIFYFIFNYIALSISGSSFTQVWETQGLYPCLLITGGPWYSLALFWISILFWVYAIQLASSAVSRITYKQLKGDEFYSSIDSLKYVKKHWRAVIFTPITLALITLFFILVSALFSLLGKIPFVGEFLFSLPYLFYFFGSVFTIYTIIVFFISFIYSPSIIGTMEEDTMGSVFQSYSLAWGQPWRIIIYQTILIPLAVFSVMIFKLISFSSIKLINIVMGHKLLMGSKLTSIFDVAANTVWPQNLFTSIAQNLSVCSIFCEKACNLGVHMKGFFDFFLPINPTNIYGTESIAAIILVFFLFIISISLLSYFLSILSVGETLMFIIFRKHSDDNILIHEDKEQFNG